MDKAILRKWLNAGFIEGRTWWLTKAGTPQGGIISPVLANMALDGLEAELRKKFKQAVKFQLSDMVNLVRHADDFIITGGAQKRC
jgi:RNA-directed DNA polymerase